MMGLFAAPSLVQFSTLIPEKMGCEFVALIKG